MAGWPPRSPAVRARRGERGPSFLYSPPDALLPGPGGTVRYGSGGAGGYLSAGGNYPRELILGGRRHTYLSFRYLVCTLAEIPFERYCESDNIVARLNLPNMRYPPERKVEAYARAVRGLTHLEPELERQLKYLDFIDIYAALDDNESAQYRHQYPEEAEKMTSFAERFREQGMQKGVQKGVQQGEARVLVRLLGSSTSAFARVPTTQAQ